MQSLIKTVQEALRPKVKDRHVLAIQDTTELNYRKHTGRVKGLGTVGNGKDVGFFMHPMMVIDTKTQACLGCSAIHLENRLIKPLKKCSERTIEEKASYRWVTAAQASKAVLSEASCVTFLGDRENDIYEFIDRIPDERTHLIVRASHNRLLTSRKKLNGHLDDLEASGEITVEVPRDIRLGREKRQAKLSIKFDELEIKKPEHCNDKTASVSIVLRVVEAKEMGCPAGQEAIHWRLLTTHGVKDFEGAKEIIFWYRQRWHIEQIFRTMKKQGLDVESSQIETAEGLMKLGVVALQAAINIMQLVLARKGDTEQRIDEVFTEEERSVLSMLLSALEGKTAKQSNPYCQSNLAWGTWIIARLGGWKGYVKSEGYPGPVVIARGMHKFHEIYTGWKLATNVCAG